MKINVKLKPNSKSGPKVEKIGDDLVIFSRQPAIDGRANEDLIKILSDYYDAPKSKIKIIRGLTSRNKIIEII